MRRLTLVTGATGFIGSYLVRQLVAEGQDVRVLVRRPEGLEERVRRRVDIVRGDLRDRDSLVDAVGGVHTLFHLAACARVWSRDPAEFTAVNTQAVDTLLEAAFREGVQRLVHVSTILTLPPYRPAPLNGSAQRPTPYEESKRAGERLVESYAASGRRAVIVHPTRVYGPGPLSEANSATRVIALYLRGRFRVRIADDDVLGNYVHAADVAAGIRLAVRRGRTGAHYVLGGDPRDANVSFLAYLKLAGELAGVKRRVIALPRRAALAAAHAALLWGRLGGTAPITPGWVRVFLEDRRVDVTPARRELGYDPRQLREGLGQTIAWLRGRRKDSPA